MANKQRKCKHCKKLASVESGIIVNLSFFCSFDHATKWAQEKGRAKVKKDTDKRHRERLKQVRRSPKAEALKHAQLLGRISNADDSGNCTCVTCGVVRPFNDGMDGGHFIAKGSSSYWALDPANIHPQCKACNGNGMKFGNKELVYTLWMIDKYGRDKVEFMRSKAKTIIKRSTKDYDDYIEGAKKEIARHKARIGVR